ncbi:hypothetical protein H072_738 [Dactylellina haptotyla CBS 200.50]|uniref:F-box domain-containing protein n=1 Tax=Dactylellina haptotyla (strain CBS 200.50) TaxID=1284197 RepID=S8CC13_DACHA|nr:hypothetical protein H072_738 [Dactylellina haptotyla CBS 200.50]
MEKENTQTGEPRPTIIRLVLIPPILDCIVTYLHTIDLIAWSAVSRATRDCLLSSHAAWRAVSFYSIDRTKHADRVRDATSVFASTIAVRSHSPGGGGGGGSSLATIPWYHGNSTGTGTVTAVATNTPGGGTTAGTTAGSDGGNSRGGSSSPDQPPRYLSIDTTLTVLARLLPLAMYTSIDLSRTMVDKYLLRDLLDTCRGLRYLRLEDCPRMRVADLVVGLYGVEKRVVGYCNEKGRRRNSGEVALSGGGGGGSGGGVSLVAEVMGRPRDAVGGGGEGGGRVGGIMLSRLTHVHTKEVRDGLYRLNELRDGVRGEIVRCMSRMEDVYVYPDMPETLDLGKSVLELKEVRTDLKLHRSTYNGPGWLERLAYSQGDYLFVLCHLLGVRLICADS